MTEDAQGERILTDEAELGRILGEMKEGGNFKASLLVNMEGLPLSCISSPFDNETIAAMVALVKNTIRQAREQIGLDDVDEVSVVQGDKMRLVCRYFVAGGEELILAAIAPPHQTYRRLTNQAIRQVKVMWKPSSRGRY
jgi:predicted regulator of Ras-like GTPase activity (Roadblock/LC7/MglB family)